MPPPDAPLDEERFRRAFAAWNEGDFDRFLEEAHPDMEYSPGIVVSRAEGEPVVYRGRDEMRRFFDEWHSVWRSELTVLGNEEFGDRILVTGRMRMTGGQSGVSVEQRVAFIGEAEDGLLRRLWSYPSEEAARAALEGSDPAGGS